MFIFVNRCAGTIGVCLAARVQQEVFEKLQDLRRALRAAWWLLAACAWLCELNKTIECSQVTACVIVIIFLRHLGLAKDVGQSEDCQVVRTVSQ